MVNLKDYEIEYLKERKPDPDSASPIVDLSVSRDKRIFVVPNRARGNMPEFLKWRMDQCVKLVQHFGVADNYNLKFELVGYHEMGIFPKAVELELAIVIKDKNSIGVIKGVRKNCEHFSFQVQQKDLDTYFKRYYPWDSPNKTEYYVSTDDGVFLKVRYNTKNKSMSAVNIKNLLIDCPWEKKVRANIKTHPDDEFDVTEGFRIIKDKWKKNWIEWFEKAHKEQSKIKLKKQEEKDREEMAKVKLTDLNTNTTTTTVANKVSNVNDTDDFSWVGSIPKSEIVGTVIGDYVVSDTHRDMNKHLIWELTCRNCHRKVYTTRSKIKNNKFDTHCSYCGSFNEDEESDSISSSNCNDNENKSGDMVDRQSDDDSACASNLIASPLNMDTEEEIILPAKTVASIQGEYVTFTEERRDLFDIPVWYYIAHCIPADFTFHGYIAKTIDKNWDMQKCLKDNYNKRYISPGMVLTERNVFNLIASPAKFTRATMEDLNDCIEELAEICYMCHIKYLAMPRIGCGANKLDWNEVRRSIVKTFNDIYNTKNDRYHQDTSINILVCLGEN